MQMYAIIKNKNLGDKKMDINEIKDTEENSVSTNSKSKSINLQELFLNSSRKEKMPITIFLTNGVQLKGTVKGFDNYVVILESEGKSSMIYKHAISTIIPSKNIPIFSND